MHRVHEGFKKERTATINRIRGLLAEFGVVLPLISSVLRERLTEVIEDASNAAVLRPGAPEDRGTAPRRGLQKAR